MDPRTAAFYQHQANNVAQRYESVPSPILEYVPLAFVSGGRVLDVGAGSGRDMAALLAGGFDVFGVEPSDGLRGAAVSKHPELTERLREGHLPALGTPFGGGFDGVVCSAVLMHVPDTDLFDAALALRRALKVHGRLLISIPAERADLGSDHRDASGRLFHPYRAEELQLLFERLGFQQIGSWRTADALGRPGTSWTTLLFELRSGGAGRTVDQIEGILNRDRKVATYKFALFRALAEIATQEPRSATWLLGGRVAVPVERIAKRWLTYYWPIFASAVTIPQSQAEGAGNSQQPVAFRRSVTELMQHFAGQGDHGGLTAWHLASSGSMPAAIAGLEREALRSISNAIRSGPVTHSGGALESGTVFDYDRGSKSVVMAADLWRELSLLGHWIIDAVIVRWAALTERFAHRQGIRSGDVLPLLLAKPQAERATALARAAYVQAGVNRCVWSGRRLGTRELAVDHVIPFSLWGNNDLWNLLPAHHAVNGHKSDKLPSSELLHERRTEVLANWAVLHDAMPEPFLRQARVLLGSKLVHSSALPSELFGRLREAVEFTALQRGIPRWTPRIEVKTRFVGD